uniref:Uncharacterized protein n=1 Tax=Toxoplasma gondii (strain ATCC 50861 / VEG) TaxID=432359 RepID=A0A0F7VFB2_TOXGV|nr:TPA: hypothetical protein BN1205_002765 [Toxoplasma gondii VEG]
MLIRVGNKVGMRASRDLGIPLFPVMACVVTALQYSPRIGHELAPSVSPAKAAEEVLSRDGAGERRGSYEGHGNESRGLSGIDAPGDSGSSPSLFRRLYTVFFRRRRPKREVSPEPHKTCPECAKLEADIARDVQEEQERRREESRLLQALHRKESDFWKSTQQKDTGGAGGTETRQSQQLASELKELRRRHTAVVEKRLDFERRRCERETNCQRREEADLVQERSRRSTLRKEQYIRSANRRAERQRVFFQNESANARFLATATLSLMRQQVRGGSDPSVANIVASLQALRLVPPVTKGERRGPGS